MAEVVRRILWLTLALAAVGLTVASTFCDVSQYSIVLAGIAGGLFALNLEPISKPPYAPYKPPRTRLKSRFKS